MTHTHTDKNKNHSALQTPHKLGHSSAFKVDFFVLKSIRQTSWQRKQDICDLLRYETKILEFAERSKHKTFAVSTAAWADIELKSHQAVKERKSRLLKARADYVICLSISADLPMVCESRLRPEEFKINGPINGGHYQDLVGINQIRWTLWEQEEVACVEQAAILSVPLVGLTMGNNADKSTALTVFQIQTISSGKQRRWLCDVDILLFLLPQRQMRASG